MDMWDVRARSGGWWSGRGRRLLAVFGVAALVALAVVGQAAASSSQFALSSSTCAANLGGTWNAATCTVSSSATLASGERLTIPQGVTLSISYGATDDSVGLTADGTILNHGTISIDYSGTGGEGLLSTGALVNNGKITISDTGFEDGSGKITTPICTNGNYRFCGGYGLDSSGVVTNHGTITATDAGGSGSLSLSRALFTSGSLANDGLMSLTVGPTACAPGFGRCGSTAWTNYQGAITNAGTIDFTVASPGPGVLQEVDGIYNLVGTISTSGTIRVEAGADGGNGIENDGGAVTVQGGGVISLQDTGSATGLLNEDGATFSVNRRGALTTSSGDGSLGLWNPLSPGGFSYGTGLPSYPPGPATVNNNGSITVESQTKLENDSTFNNFGTINNAGTFNQFGTFNEFGTCNDISGGMGCP